MLVSLLITTIHANGDNTDDSKPHINPMDGMFGGQNQVCQSFSCPKPYVPVNKWPLSITSTGCQSTNGMVMSMGGDDAYKHVEHCCHHKQACYQICGSNKQLCDKELEKCMDEGCTELPGLTPEEASSMSEDDKQKETEECKKTTGIVKLLANMSGCNEYDGQQRRVCECVEKDKLEEKMERVLRNFYKKYNPDGIDKVKGLVSKANGKRPMFSKILYGLVKKYDGAIKKTKPETIDPLKMDL